VESISSLFYRGCLKVERGPFSYSVNISGDDVFVKFNGYQNLKIILTNKHYDLESPETTKTYRLELSVHDESGLLEEFTLQGVAKGGGEIINFLVFTVLPITLARIFMPLWLGSAPSFLLTDSRAGVLRISRTVMTQALQHRGGRVPAKGGHLSQLT